MDHLRRHAVSPPCVACAQSRRLRERRPDRQTPAIPLERTAGVGDPGGAMGGLRPDRRLGLGLAVHPPLVGPDRLGGAGGASESGGVLHRAGDGSLAPGRSLLRPADEPAVLRLPGRRQDVPLPGGRRDAGPQPAGLHRPPHPTVRTRLLSRRDPLLRLVLLVRGGVPLLRTRPPLHIRHLRGAHRVQASLGMLHLLSLLLPGRTLGGRRPAESRHVTMAPLRIRGHLLRRMDPHARRQYAEVLLQDEARARISGLHETRGPERRHGLVAVRGVLGRRPACQLPGRDSAGDRSDSGPRLSGPLGRLALSSLLHCPVLGQGTGRRAPVRSQIRRPVDGIRAACAAAYSALAVLISGPPRGRRPFSHSQVLLASEPTVRARTIRRRRR